MTAGDVASILFGVCVALIVLRVPVAVALGLACIPIFYLDPNLRPILMLGEMIKAYNSFVLLAVPFFILAANMMNSSGITQRLVDFSGSLVGHLRGGLGHINVMVSMLFAGISGSSTADAAGIGSLMIPAMKKQGYDASFTVAITACSSVMGVIVPPSILMIVWGGIMSVSIGGLFLAGFIPGILVGLSQMVAVWGFAHKRGYPISARASVRYVARTFGRAILAVLAPAIIIGGVVFGFVTPTEASVIAVLYTGVVGMGFYRSVGVRNLPRIFYETGRLASISLFCIGTASAFGWLLAFYQIPKAVGEVLGAWTTTVTLTGLIVAAAFLAIGCFIDAIPAMIILGTILQPLADQVGMHPIHFAMIGIVALAFGLVTPPYGLCLLIACSIGEIGVKQALKDVVIVLLPMLAILLIIILFPDLVLFLPRLVLPQYV
jgi:tripartite ATP-independent transporter DctM subunit